MKISTREWNTKMPDLTILSTLPTLCNYGKTRMRTGNFQLSSTMYGMVITNVKCNCDYGGLKIQVTFQVSVCLSVCYSFKDRIFIFEQIQFSRPQGKLNLH